MRLALLLASASVLALVNGCASSEEETSDADDSAYTAQDAACFSEKAKGEESATDARARCLTARADKLIDDLIAKKEDPRDKALVAFKGKLRVPAETGCFTEDVSPGFTGAWQYDLDSARDVGMVSVQVKAAVEFLKHVYRDLDGYPNHVFDALEICPNGQVGGDLRLTGSRLRVGVRTGWFGRVGVHTSSDLRAKWTAGEHLEGDDTLSKLKGMRWSLLDPVGTPRVTVRRAVRGFVSKLSARLGQLDVTDAKKTRAELSQVVREQVSNETPEGSSEGSVQERALAKIASMSPQQLTVLIQDWRAQLDQKDVPDGVEEATVSMRDVLNQRDVKVHVTQRGFVNIQNFKQISVDTEFLLPGAQRFARHVDASKTETTIEVSQEGAVNVQLNDVISVRVQVLYRNTAQTATLESALGR
jgi:hypothetical protein